ncbi:MAG: LptF/LptG family permease [Bacteroidales bacterium]|nr:LptF/LptG family permease [Bacteroidales bacterium]
MKRIKRIDAYLIKNFLTLFFITFFICLFIVIMQFLWMHVNDLVGKGLPIKVLMQFFFYASLSMVPLALPLAILLASLMTFGNLGERLELLALKSAGISLFRIMRGLIVLISFIVVGAFFFSNNVIPVAQKKMWTLMFSIRQTSPELDVPVGEFYSGIKGMNLYVRGKNHKTQALENVMIYDFSNGFNNASVTTADSVHIKLTEDKRNLVLQLYGGEQFENLKKQQFTGASNVPYRRETFTRKDILIDFDSNFQEIDESILDNQHVSKNIVRLTHDIDSANHRTDSLITTFTQRICSEGYFDKAYEPTERETARQETLKPTMAPINADSIFLASSQKDMDAISKSARQKMQNARANLTFHRISVEDTSDFRARHNIEWHQKFTLSLACLIFFFIGAPLGAIIGKGGLGVPTVISIILFLIYYIINTTGIKMARELIWPVWQGMWLSSFVLAPIGIFFTYKAATDSAIFKSDAYKIWWQKVRDFCKNHKKTGSIKNWIQEHKQQTKENKHIQSKHNNEQQTQHN